VGQCNLFIGGAIRYQISDTKFWLPTETATHQQDQWTDPFAV